MPPNEELKRMGKSSDRIDKNKDKDKEKDKNFIAVRWPSTLRKSLKVAAAGNDPPLTMTEYLAECFNKIQDVGGLDKTASDRLRRTDREQHRRFQEAGEKLFRTHDRRLIDCVILLLEYATR